MAADKITTSTLVREMKTSDINPLVDYWTNLDFDTAFTIGIDRDKIPDYSTISQMLMEQINLPLSKKNTYILICELGGKAVGHSNISPVYEGEQANVHVHIWEKVHRNSGLGLSFLKECLPVYFREYNLNALDAIVHTHNQAANNFFAKAGFQFVEEYESQPGDWSFYQSVKKYRFKKEDFLLTF